MTTLHNTEVSAVVSSLVCTQGFHFSLQPGFLLALSSVLGTEQDRTDSCPCWRASANGGDRQGERGGAASLGQ